MKMYLIGVLLLISINSANAVDNLWSSAVPTEVHIVPEGLVLLGDFNHSGITCATGTKAIMLEKSDPNFDYKLSLALTAKATGKKIEVLLTKSLDSNCTLISAHGYVPVAFYYYWRLK